MAYANDQPETASAHATALAHSDFVFVCTVQEESPHAHGPKAVFKSYRVTYPESLYFGMVGLDIPGEIWIHYDSNEYPDVPKSGFETTFHKGDSFIAFLDHVDKGDQAFRIVRLDKVDVKDEIKKAIKDHRTKPSTTTKWTARTRSILRVKADVGHKEMNKKALTFLSSVVLIAAGAFGADEEYEKANRDGAFILAHNRYSAVSIGVDTTNPDLLKLAIELQETLSVLGGARPPIENVGPVAGPGSTNLMWQMIYFVQDLRSMGKQPLYTVAWEYLQPGNSINCPKRLRIAYRDVAHAREAIEAILNKEFGTGLTGPNPKIIPQRLLVIPTQTPEQSQQVVVRQIMKKE